MGQTGRGGYDDAVAVVGIGCRFPGGVANPADFWRFLREGRDAITEIPRDRFDLSHYYDERPATPGRVMTRWGGFLEQLESFDAAFFGISPREAQRLDPQQRLLLETAWEALEDAGQDVRRLEGSATGVFVGQWLSDFEARLFADPEAVDFYMTTGSGRYTSSGRLSYVLGLRGPSLTVDTACSSSLVAVHMAVRSIRSGESKLALAGGVNVILQPHISVAYSQSRMMAPDGRCKFGDAGGDGYVRSEGAGLVVLKSVAAAQAAGDRIYAVIRGSAVNNDGRSSGSMGTPSRVGQQELLRAAYLDAGVSVADVGYIEAHGTGTRAGDPVELGALSTTLSDGREAGLRVRVGSVKTNFGHTEGAAGIAGLMKATLCLHHQAIPASLHCKTLNPVVPWAESCVEIARTQTDWPAEQRIAGVSAFGIAGTNAHVVLEGQRGAPAVAASVGSPRASCMLPLSARSPDALRALATRYAALLADPNGPELAAVSAAAAIRRTSLDQRAAFVATNRQAMVEVLERYAAGETTAVAEGSVQERKADEPSPRIAFVVPGQGAQWVGMGRQLLASEPVFLEALRECDVAARRWVDWSVLEELQREPGTAGYKLDRIDVTQPVLIAMAIAYAAWLRSVGIEPDAVVGHSMGEVGAAYLAGVLTLDQAMRIICRRSALMRTTSGCGAMAVIDLPMGEAAERLHGLESRVAVAVNNSPRSCVISGDPEAVKQVITRCEQDGIFCRLVKVDVASHSPQMDEPSRTLIAELADLIPAAARLPMYSTVLARSVSGEELDAAYWGSNMRRPVRFAEGVERLLDAGTTIFLELGPHPLLLPAIQQTAQARDVASVTTVACGRREEPEQANLLAVVAHLWTSGVPIEWQRVAPERGHVQLPNYPWQRERHWVENAELVPAAQARRHGGRAVRMDAEALACLYRLAWRVADPVAAASNDDAPASKWLIVCDDERLAAAVVEEAARQGVAAARAPLASDRPDGAFSRVVLIATEHDDAAFLPVEALQAALATPGRHPRLWFVTRGGQSIETQTQPSKLVSVSHRALWGAARVIAEEHPDLWGGLVDLDPEKPALDSVGMLIQHLLADDPERQVALRDGKRYCQRLEKHSPQVAVGGFEWRPDVSYLITGGLGDIGLIVARAMVEQGARRLVLVGRTALPAREMWSEMDPTSIAGRRIKAVRELEAAGASVHIAAVDVADESRVAAFLEQYRREAWPTIRGVVHAAGSLVNQLSDSMDRRTFAAVVEPKLTGARILDRLLPDLDLFVLFSSTGSFLAQAGQANYGAANAGLDAIALNRRARGLPAHSIAWGVWRGTGLVKGEAGERNVAEMARQGIQSFAPERGAALFQWLCGSTETLAIAMPIEWDLFRRSRGSRDTTLYAEVAADAGTESSGEASLAEKLAAVGPAERRQLLDTAVRAAVGKVLSINPARIDARKAFGSMGLGSLGAMELRNRLEAVLGRPLSATLAWNHPNVDALVSFLIAPPAQTVTQVVETAVSTGSAVSGAIAEVAALSDEDALAALRTRRPGARR